MKVGSAEIPFLISNEDDSCFQTTEVLINLKGFATGMGEILLGRMK